MNFLQPAYVSSTSQPDEVKIVFNDTSMFVSTKGIGMKQTETSKKKLPKLATPNQININARVVVIATFSTLAVTFTLQFALKAVLSSMLTQIQIMGLIVHMFLVSLSYPLNCFNFFGQLFSLVSFNLIPTGYIFEKIFKFSRLDDEWLTDWFYWIGYSSMFAVNNMSTIFVLMIVLPFWIAKLEIISKIGCYLKLLPQK